MALVKSAKGTAATATVNPAFASATTTGNLIVLAFAADDYNATPDSGWTQSPEMEQQTFHGAYLWWRISAGETSFTYTIGSATNSAWVIAEFSGLEASPYDISEGQFQQSSGTISNYSTPTIIPTTGDRLLVAMSGWSVNLDMSGQTLPTWANSFTYIDSNGSGGGGTNDLCGMAYREVTGDGSTGFSTNTTPSPNSITQSRSGLIISFKVSSGEVPPAEPDPDVWEFVGVSNVVEVTATGHTLVTTGIAGALQEGDLIVAVIGSRIASTTQITLPSAEWTRGPQQMNSSTVTTTSALASGLIAWCVRGAANPSFTFTHPAAPSVALGRLIVYRNVHRGKPFNVSNAVTTAVNTTAVSVAGVTTTEDKTLLVVGAIGGQEAAWSAFDAAGGWVTRPSGGNSVETAAPMENGFQERQDSPTNTGADMSLAIADAVKVLAGATGNLTASASLGAGHVILEAAFNLAMRPNAPVVSRDAVMRAASW